MQWVEQEIEQAHTEDISHPGNLPFFLSPPEPNGHAVLLIHGFGASPQEMRPLGNALLKYHVTSYGVRLPGHGTTPEDLATRDANEWLTTIHQNYRSLVDTGYEVSIAGLSTGALLTLKMALQDHPAKLVLLAPFLRLQHQLAPFAGLIRYFIPYQKKEISPAERPFYYQKRPLKGIAQVNKLARQLRGELHRITTPSLILTSTGDATIASGTAAEIYRQLGGNKKQFHCYGNNVPHVLTSDQNPSQQDVLRRCINFIISDSFSTTTGAPDLPD